MRRTFAILAVLALGMPILSAVLVPREADAITLPPLILPHNGKVVLNNFTGMQAVNISLNDTGAASLRDAGRVWGAGIQPGIRMNYSTDPAVAAGPDDRFVAAWPEYNGPSSWDIYAAIFDAKGNMIKERFPVAAGPSLASRAAVACGPDGSFMVGWFDSRSGWYAVFGQRFDRDGNKVGPEMNISSENTNKGYFRMAANSKGDYILVWDEARQTDYHIYARMFSKNGASLGDEILVVGGSDGQQNPSVAFDSQDRFAVAWSNFGGQVCATVMFQRFDAAGVKLGTPVAPAVADYPRYSPFLAYDPQDNLVMAWNDYHVGGKYDYDIYAQRFDLSGARMGAEMLLAGGAGQQTADAFAIDSKGTMMVAWSDNTTGAYQVYAVMVDTRGGVLPKTIVAGSSAYANETCQAMACSQNDHFMVLWTERYWYGNYSYYNLYARPCLQTNALAGTLATGALASPANLWRWDALSADVRYGSASSNAVSFEFSTDGGANWTALPANGSLAAAGTAPLSIRAKLSSLDNLTTPVLRSITLAYKYNVLPVVKLPADMTVKKGANVTIPANVTDTDLLDVALMNYRWTQIAGKNLTLVNATGQNLSFKADKAGTFTFRLVANDGWNDSAPATITVKVTETKPPAKSGYEWAPLLAGAMLVVLFIRRRRTSRP